MVSFSPFVFFGFFQLLMWLLPIAPHENYIEMVIFSQDPQVELKSKKWIIITLSNDI